MELETTATYRLTAEAYGSVFPWPGRRAVRLCVCYATYMSDNEMQILDKIWKAYADDPFLPGDAMELFTFNELPEMVRARLKASGPGVHSTRAFVRFLESAGCTRLPSTHRRGDYFVAPSRLQSGRCRHCNRESGNVTLHERYCLEPAVLARVERAGAHAVPNNQLRPTQRFRQGVTDLDVARVLELLERGAPFVRRDGGAARGWHLRDPRVRLETHVIVNDMLRTALAREFWDDDGWHLVPALVHLNDGRGQTACRVDGETFSPRRVRLLADLALVDCLNCERAVSKSVIRGL